MVLTRDIPRQTGTGRERTMAFIRSALSEAGEPLEFRIQSLFEQRSLRRLAWVLFAWLSGLLRGRPVPLQSLLFFDPRYRRKLVGAIVASGASAVYFDGVRSGIYAERLRREYPALRLVCDFDDLMSRRMEMLTDTRQGISMGYMSRLIPAWVQRHVLDGLMARWVTRYEARALRHAERRIAACCDTVVLVSPIDAAHFHDQFADAPLTVIPPFMSSPRFKTMPLRIERFVFIGSDTLLQNQKTIDYLVSLWQRVRPATPLFIFGKQVRSYGAVPRVQFQGFADSLEDVYAAGSVLLAPSFVSGGVKTKILEAMSYGVIPVGTKITFEGIDARTDALTFDETGLIQLVLDPAICEAALGIAGDALIRDAGENHSASRLGDRWRCAIWPDLPVASRLQAVEVV